MRFLVILMGLLAPVQAAALSCVPWHMENAFAEARDSEDAYIIVHGKLTFRESALPKVDLERQDQTSPTTRIRARIKGNGLSATGFDVPFNDRVTFIVGCIGPWCAGARSGEDSLAFLKRVNGGYELSINACGGHLFAQPDAAMLDKVRACFDGDTCEPRPW